MNESITAGGWNRPGSACFNQPGRIFFDLNTEVVGVRLHSVMAPVRFAHDDRQQFAQGARQFRRAEHHRLI